MKYLISLCALVISTSAFAINSDSIKGQFNDLPEAKKAEIALAIAQAAETQKKDAPVSVPSTATVEKWVGFGEQIGKALSGTARELGVVANDFIKTPAGQITLAMIVWKVMGSDIIGIMMAITFFVTLNSIWLYMYRRMCVIKGIHYTTTQEGDKTKTVKHVEYYNSTKDDVSGYQVMMSILLIIINTSVVIIGL